MSTRKSRLNTDSPTPNSGSAESVASTTPTTPTARAKRSVRNKKPETSETTPAAPISIKTEKIDDEDEAVKESIDEEEKSEASKTDEVKKEVVVGIAATRKRRITTARDESAVTATAAATTAAATAAVATTVASSDTSSPSTTDDGKTSPIKVKRPRRSAIEILTGDKPIDTPRIGKRRNSTGKIEKPARKLSSRIKKLTQMRKVNMKRKLLKKPDNKLTTTISRPPTKQLDALKQSTAAAAKKGKVEKNSDSASDSELLKIRRRRSDSVSKCSDMTDTSSFQETKETDELPLSGSADAAKGVEIKQESVDKDEEMATKADGSEVSAPTTRSANDSGGDADNSQTADECKRPQYRLRRKPIAHPLPQKVMNTRSRSETPSKIDATTTANAAATKNRSGDEEATAAVANSSPSKDIKKESVESPLHIETVANETAPPPVAEEKVEAEVEVEHNSNSNAVVDAVATKSDGENSESLSPLLVSEGLSEISVKQFYGRPDFLENNLGIEKDPKLGDIVQVQEKIKSESTEDSRSDNEKPKSGQIDAIADEATPAKVTEQEGQTISKADNEDENDFEDGKRSKDDEEGDEEDGEEEAEEEEEEEEDEADEVEQEKPKSPADTDDANCFVKPIEQVRKNSTSLLNENLLLNGEIEVRPKEKKVATKIADADVVSEVVLYTITNGMRVNPEKLEKIIESQKQKEKDEQMAAANDERCAAHANGDASDSTESAHKEKPIILDGTTITKIEDPIEIEDNEPPPQPTAAAATTGNSAVELHKPASNCTKGDRSEKDSPEIVPTPPSSIEDESMEDLKQKESHLKTLGLLTHQAAVEATIEKQKRREQLKASIASSSTAGGKGKKNSSEYTGTLKTVIKLHRGGGGSSSSTEGKKKGNLPLKMTLHKGRAKNGGNGNNSNDRSDAHSAANSEEDTYYTIQNQDMDGMDCNDALAEEAAAKEHEKLLVIPEKASSFRYHPEKLCEDQCFYCGGKFGLFDTPCHVAQIKSADRQKKILDNEEKLTVDSCLCDACFRHVDRRANCASYKKRLSAPPPTTASLTEFETGATDTDEKALQQNPNATASEATLFQTNKEPIACLVAECTRQASHSLRRKWALKLRKTIAKSIAMNFDNTNSQTFLPICDKHCDDIGHMLVCVLCNRKLKTRHSYFINKDSNKVEPLLSAKGIPVVISSASVVCKLCHNYVNLLLKPQDVATNFIDNYTQRLLEYYQKVELIDDDSENDQSRKEQSEEPSLKRARVAKRGRKSSPDLSTPSSATNSDDGQPRHSKTNADLDASSESHQSRSERQRHKSKQQQLQQQQQQQQKKLPLQTLLAEQQRVEQRVQQEQMKLKQQELLQQQKQQEEIRQIQLRASNEDISNLRTNPNISMRELFPGEEEMGLNVSLPFSTNSWRTPDGWSKVSSTVQYDEPTRRLWEELQKPYGNQSSFLRHLILLEKYFRNGDLVLAPNANLNAATYAESVQHRLQSYDNIPPRPISLTQLVSTAQAAAAVAAATTPAHSENVLQNALEMRKPSAESFRNAKSFCKTFSNSDVTITKATTGSSSKSASKTASNATDAVTNSLLKSNAPPTNSTHQRRSYTMTTEPITNNNAANDTSAKANNASNAVGGGGKGDATKTTNTSASNNGTNNSTGTPKNNKSSIGLPPELICINTSTPNDKHQQQLLSQQLYQAQMQLTMQQHLQQQHQSLLLTQQHKLQPIVQPQTQVTPPKKTGTSANASASAVPAATTNSTIKSPNVIRLPDTLTEAERRESKQWRPTLMPVSAAKANSNNEVLYQTADGRRLPNLVQVQSQAKPYMISIHDYNRMCILRRERLLRDQEMMKSKSTPPASMQSPSSAIANQQQSKPSATITSGQLATVVTSPPPSLTATSSNSTADASTKKVQIPNKILEQNSLIPINVPKSTAIDNSADSLLKVRKNQSSLLKTNATNAILMPPKLTTPSSAHGSVTATVVASNAAKLPLIASALSQSNVVSITSTPSISAILAMNTGTPSSTPPPIQIESQPITITSVSSLPQSAAAQNIAQNNVSALEALFKTTNQVTTTPATMWHWAETLNNKSNSGIGITPIKIPKSLTVIPQQRLTSKNVTISNVGAEPLTILNVNPMNMNPK